jgi:hypothetical protein
MVLFEVAISIGQCNTGIQQGCGAFDHQGVAGPLVRAHAALIRPTSRLYEQKKTAPERAAALDDYLTRWVRWTTAGLKDVSLHSSCARSDAQEDDCQSYQE